MRTLLLLALPLLAQDYIDYGLMSEPLVSTGR